ncbi:murein DD-endopeptidase MepM/ murein hydrolase activator NlpD [Agromyces sp. 3263]|uniref:murein hydrolase activator EnvC family protein n=1 Tax=Agromyces sp. 3263 TaxID=2817750 RepID=UPI00285BEC1E|nr:M23 family metallopeptidase [Agromyces sp. 3263]MDR6907589.1 murein DD-endopeptidase MepM/ murein hydrolase activator NlpD [Agromyces sp. 3263]
MRIPTSRRRVGIGLALTLALAATPAGTLPVSAVESEQDGSAPLRTAAALEDPWRWPVPAPIRVVAPFRAPAAPYAAGHRGIDVAADSGALVVAPADGVVSFAGPVVDRGVVAIDHGDGLVSAIEPVEAAVAAGTIVRAGDIVGRVATGGHCASGCVHFGVRIDGAYVSPFLFLGGLPRAVLLPLDGT